MSHMAGFLSTVFASPLLRKSVPLEQLSAPHVLVYTDTSFAPGPCWQRGLGVVVWDAVTNRQFYSSQLCPKGIIARHFWNADHIICQLGPTCFICRWPLCVPTFGWSMSRQQPTSWTFPPARGR